jgi:predicted small secreted protein
LIEPRTDDRQRAFRLASIESAAKETLSMPRILSAIVLIAALLLSGCNTVKGLGRDIESVGRAGEEAID